MITEDYVNFETAKLLKEKGFKNWCYKCYGDAVYHKGVPISFDEECELKSEGLEDEIEYVEGGCLYDYGCSNSDKDTKVWAAPTLWAAMKLLREAYNFHIWVEPNHDKEGLYNAHVKVGWWSNNWAGIGYNTYEEACEAAIKYCLENLIVEKN